MTNTKAVQMNAANSSPANTAKLSLKEKVKKYLIDNCDIISAVQNDETTNEPMKE